VEWWKLMERSKVCIIGKKTRLQDMKFVEEKYGIRGVLQECKKLSKKSTEM